MTQLRVKSPLLHDGQRFEVGDLIDESVLSEGQSDVLLAADILETVEDAASSETPAEPAAAEESAPAEAAEPAAEEASETPAEEATEAEEPAEATPSEA